MVAPPKFRGRLNLGGPREAQKFKCVVGLSVYIMYYVQNGKVVNNSQSEDGKKFHIDGLFVVVSGIERGLFKEKKNNVSWLQNVWTEWKFSIQYVCLCL